MTVANTSDDTCLSSYDLPTSTSVRFEFVDVLGSVVSQLTTIVNRYIDEKKRV